MTIRTGLVIDGDASGAQRALKLVDDGMEQAEAGARGLSAASAEAAKDTNALTIAEEAAARGALATANAMRQVGAAAIATSAGTKDMAAGAVALAGAQDRATRELIETANAYQSTAAAGAQYQRWQQSVTASTGAQKAGMQQLSMQVGDMATMYAMGAKPMQIFASQSAQVIGAVQLMTGGTSKLANFMGGPWGMAMTAATLVLVPLIGKLFETANAADTARGALDELIKKRREEEGETNKAILAQQAVTTLGQERAVVLGKIATAEGIVRAEREKGINTAQRESGIARLRNRAAQMEFDIAAAQEVVDRERAATNAQQAQALTQRMDAQAQLNAATNAGEKAQANYALRIADIGAAWEKSDKGAEAQQARIAGMASAMRDLSSAQAAATAAQQSANAAEAERKRLAEEAKRDYEQRATAAAAYAKSLEEQSLKFGKSALEIHRIEVAAQAANAPLAALNAQITANGAKLEGQMIGKAVQDFNDLIASIDAETAALAMNSGAAGQNAEKRAIANLALEKTSLMAKWAADGITNLDAAWMQYSTAQLAKASMADGLEAQKKAADELTDAMGELHDLARDIRFGDMFEGFGEGLDGILDGMNRIEAAEKAYQKSQTAAGGDREKLAKADQVYSAAKLANTVNMLGATKRLFAEQSAGYKAVQVAEQAAAAVALVNTAKNVAGGAAKIFNAIPAPWAFPVVTAMLGVMAGLGFSGGGGGASVAPPSSDELQARIGTGSVLGDAGAQSESLSNALDILAENSNSDLEYSTQMVRELRSISDGINRLTGQIGQQLTLGSGMFDTSSFSLGQTGSSGLLGLIGGSSTTRSLYDQGIQVFQSSVEQVLAAGFEAQVYNVVEQIKKSSGFLGIGGSTKTTYQTITGQVQPAIEEQMQLIVGNVSQSVVSITKQIGIDVSQAIGAVLLPEAKLSFKDMSGSEIEGAMQAYFSSIADQIAAVSSQGDFVLGDFQKAGEGLYETLARTARTITTVGTSLKSIGMGPAAGVSATVGQTAAASSALTDMFGGLDPLQEAIAAFSKSYLTEAERMAPVIAAVRDEMDRLGQAGVTTNEQFKSLVLGLDLGTASGQELFTSLMSVGPAFAKVTGYLGSLDGVLNETGKTAQELATIQQRMAQRDITIMELRGLKSEAQAARDVAELAAADELEKAQVALLQQLRSEADVKAEAARLEQEYLQIAGNSAALRAAELAAVSDANRVLKERNLALADEKAQLDKLNAIAATRRDIAIQLAEAEGRIADAQQMRRDDTLRGLDPSLWDDMRKLWSVQDNAAQKAASSLNNFTSAIQDFSNVVPFGGDLGLRDPGIQLPDLDQFEALKKQFFELTGAQSAAVTAQQELAKMDARLQPIQTAINAANDLKDAEDRVATARQVVAEAAERETSALKDAAAKWQQIGGSLRAASAAVFISNDNGDARSLQTVQAEMFSAAALARQQDANAMERLPDLVKDYLTRSEASATNMFELRRAQAYSATSLNDAALASESGASTARAQLSALEKLVKSQDSSEEKLVAVVDAVASLKSAMDEQNRLRAASDTSTQSAINTIETILRDMRRKAEEEAQAVQDANDPVNGKGTAKFPLFMKMVP